MYYTLCSRWIELVCGARCEARSRLRSGGSGGVSATAARSTEYIVIAMEQDGKYKEVQKYREIQGIKRRIRGTSKEHILESTVCGG